MPFYPQKHHRRSVRLRDYDYSQAGAYFITICAYNRECLFGGISNGQMVLNDAGRVANKCWYDIPVHFSHVKLDEWIIMPNHVHGIIIINADCRGGVTPPLRKYTLGQIIAYFKYQTTKQINQIRETPGIPVWQRNYYEHIIRNEKEFKKILLYIEENPILWEYDRENPNCTPVAEPVKEVALKAYRDVEKGLIR